MPDLITLTDILAARDRIAGTAIRTPLVALVPERLRGAGFDFPSKIPEIYLKNEAAQPIGSFKLRGAYNKVAALKERDPEAFARGVITFSSGNHAQGVAFAARALGTHAVIVMPDNAPPLKRAATEAMGATVVLVGPASSERKLKAEELVAAHGYEMIPPYDDAEIIAGQATCGLELAAQLAELDRSRPARTLVLSPVSGGGLLSGVASGLTLACEAEGRTAPSIWGCEPELAADAYESFYSGALVEWPAASTTRTLADGLRTQSLGALNFRHIRHFAGGIVRVTEQELRTATRLLLAATDIVPEPSGAVTTAAALFHVNELPSAERMVAIVSGGNLDPDLRAELESETASALASANV